MKNEKIKKVDFGSLLGCLIQVYEPSLRIHDLDIFERMDRYYYCFFTWRGYFPVVFLNMPWTFLNMP